jgi:hypothetical protein
VAITKCDAANAQPAQPARVRQQLLVAGLELEEVGGNIQVGVWGRVAVWGVLWDCFGKKRDDGMPVGRGSTCQSVSCSHTSQPASRLPNSPSTCPHLSALQVVEVAAVTGQGLLELEEALLLQADLMELRASRTRRAEAVVIEAKVDKGQGPVATVVVKRGTLKVSGQGRLLLAFAAACAWRLLLLWGLGWSGCSALQRAYMQALLAGAGAAHHTLLPPTARHWSAHLPVLLPTLLGLHPNPTRRWASRW